jgi:hypothetical protein
LYVAVTRARDRLYLASPLKDGALVPGRGSLAEVLPDSMKAFFGRALAVFDQVDTVGWTGVSGREYNWTLCRPRRPDAGIITMTSPSPETPPVRTDDYGLPATGATLRRFSTTRWVEDDADAFSVLPAEGASSDRLLGVLIHRLFESADRLGDPASSENLEDRAAAYAQQLLRPEELAAIQDPPSFARRAARSWLDAASRCDVAEALSGTSRLYEVPFSMHLEVNSIRSIVRGTIDCVVRKDPAALKVVEFKTGRAQPDHQRQLDLYVRAAQALHPGERVDGILIYI